MKLLTEYKFHGFLYGFMFGFFACLVVLTSTYSSKEVPLTEILTNSFWTGLVIGFVGWFFLALSIGGMASGTFGTGHSGDSYGGDSYGGDGGGDGSD